MVEFTETVTRIIDCPACGSGSVIKAGPRNGQQRYKCKECNKKFRVNGTAEGRRYDVEVIGAVIRAYYAGMSYKQIAELMEDFLGIDEPSKDTLYQWVSDYTDAAIYTLRDVKATTSDHWVADEMYVKVGGITAYQWNIMDRRTRFMLASHLSAEKTGKEATIALKKALARADRPPSKITTDSNRSYDIPIKALFPNAEHIHSQGIESPINNNRIERLNGTYRSRDKVLRGMDSMASAQQFLDGLTVQYNYFRDHEALKGRKPYEAARIDAPFKEWADVVRAGVKAPPSWCKKVTQRGTAKVPRAQAERAIKLAEDKKAKGKGRGRPRAPKAVLPDTPGAHVNRQLNLIPPKVMRSLRPQPPSRSKRK